MKKTRRYFIPLNYWNDNIKYIVYQETSLDSVPKIIPTPEKATASFDYINNGNWTLQNILVCVKDGIWKEVLEEELALMV